MPDNPNNWAQALRDLWALFGTGAITALAIATRLLVSPVQSWRMALAVVSSGVLVAVVGTGPLTGYLQLDGQTSQAAISAALALTGERIVRHILDVSENPSKLAELWRWWRGGQ